MVRRTEREFIGVAPLGGEDGLVAAGKAAGLRVGHGFAVTKIQLGAVEAGVACPGGVAIERPAWREFVHAVQGEGFGGNDTHVGGFGFGVAVGADGVGKGAAHRSLEGRAHQFPFGIAAQVVADFGAVVCAQTQGVVHVPQPGEVVAEAPIAAFHAGIAVGKAVAAQRGESAEVGILAQIGGGVLRHQAEGNGVPVVDFIGNGGLDGDGFHAQLVQVVAQHGIMLVFGAGAEGNVHAQAEGKAVV